MEHLCPGWENLKFIAFLTLLTLLLGLWCTFLFAVDDESGPGFLFVPFEAC
jgi:hypothetical protein